jgi:adenylate kinase
MAGIIIVTGTPGAGKTTIVNALRDEKRYSVVAIGALMQEIAGKKVLTKNRDEIRYLSNSQITGLRTATFKQIAAMDGNVVVDTHASIAEHGRYVPGLPFYAMKLLKKTRALVYFDSTAEDIIARRSTDKSRRREAQETWEIDNQRIINISTLSYYAAYLNIPLYIISNKQGEMENAVRDFSRAVDEIFSDRK